MATLSRLAAPAVLTPADCASPVVAGQPARLNPKRRADMVIDLWMFADAYGEEMLAEVVKEALEAKHRDEKSLDQEDLREEDWR